MNVYRILFQGAGFTDFPLLKPAFGLFYDLDRHVRDEKRQVEQHRSDGFLGKFLRQGWL